MLRYSARNYAASFPLALAAIYYMLLGFVYLTVLWPFRLFTWLMRKFGVLVGKVGSWVRTK